MFQLNPESIEQVVAQPLAVPANSIISQMDVPGRAQKDNKDGRSEGSPDGLADGYPSATGGTPRKRRSIRKGLDKKFECPKEGCGKCYTRAMSLYDHQTNLQHWPIYHCDFPDCTLWFVRQDLCNRHRDRHTAYGSQLYRKDSTLSQTHASPVTESGEPLQATVGPDGLRQHISPFSLPPPGFNTGATNASTRDPKPTYPTSTPTEFQGDSMSQFSALDMLLDQIKTLDTMPAFESYSESTTTDEAFTERIFSWQDFPFDSSSMGQTGQQAYENYPDNQNQYHPPHFAYERSPDGSFPANQQPHNPMAVTSLLNPSQSEMENPTRQESTISTFSNYHPPPPPEATSALLLERKLVNPDLARWDLSSFVSDQVDTQLKAIDDPARQITINGVLSQNGKVKSPSNIIRQRGRSHSPVENYTTASPRWSPEDQPNDFDRHKRRISDITGFRGKEHPGDRDFHDMLQEESWKPEKGKEDEAADAWPRGYDEDEALTPANQQLQETSNKAPFTDSGYASLPNLNHSSHISTTLEKSRFPANMEPPTTVNEIDREDARTSYSEATTVGPAHAQIYITELCSDIFSKLGSSFDAKLWITLSGALPGLIKAFAIKIGYDSSAQVNQDIMYFIHKRHEDVITQLRAMLRQQDDDEPDSCRNGHEGMSLREKMSLWGKKAVEDDLVIESGDLYQGVKDDEDEIIEGVDLLLYRKTILNSAAYKWLLASLKKESSLQWSAIRPRVVIESIRLRILDKLPTGTISKRRALNVYEVKFGLQWGTSIETRLEDGLLDRLEIPGRSFAEFITVTGSPEEAQALTIKEYLSQTWPGSGPRLLDILQKTIDHCGHQYSVKLPDNTQLEARISGSRLILTATGPANFIAECGEQLAWLRAALLGSSRRFIVYCTPSISTYLVDTVSSISEKSKYKGHCSIDFDISHVANRCSSAPRVQNGWQALIGESVVILGFPIARRPETYPGLELSFNRLLCVLEAKNTTIANGRVLLKGPERTLQLMKHSDNFFLWHPLHAPEEVCSCCMEHHIKINVGMPLGSIDSNILKAGRHILSNCADLPAPFSNNKSPSRIFENLSVPRPKKLVSQSKFNLNGSLSMLHPHENDESVSMPLITGRVIRPVAEDCLSSFHKKHWETHSSSNDQNTPTVNSQSVVTTGSADESLDSDLLSISDYSEQHEPLDSNEPAYSFLNTLLQRLLSGFQSRTQTQVSPSGNGKGAITRAPATGSSTTSGDSRQCRKRGRDETDDDDAGQDGFLRPPRKKSNPGQGKASQRSLACPYLKFDPIKHRSCCAKQLSRIRDVKQHLSRRHTPERYCQRCLETNFMDERSLDGHININTCPLKDRALLEGLSHQQQKQLSRKSNPSLSEEDQWFAIWEITFPKTLFPGLRRPLSAYMDTGLSMDMRLFREYCSNHGPSMLTEQIESDPAWSRSEITAEQRRVYLDRVILQGIDSLFAGYLRSNISSDSTTPSMQNSNNMHPTPTPTGSIADSGVALESQLSSGEASYQEGLLDQLPRTGRLDYQLTVGDDRVQGNSTIRESTVEPSQTHRESILDMNPPDMYPPDRSFDFSQISDIGSPTFADDAFQYFQDD